METISYDKLLNAYISHKTNVSRASCIKSGKEKWESPYVIPARNLFRESRQSIFLLGHQGYQ